MTIKLSKIQGFQNIYKTMSLRGQLGEMTWTSKIKLHGTNAGVRLDRDGSITAQKRSDDITPDDDNAGFAAFVEKNRDFFASLDPYKYFCGIGGHEIDYVVIFGEWAGPGIQKAVAVSDIPEKQFFIFSVQYGAGNESYTVYAPYLIERLLNLDPVEAIKRRIHILPMFKEHYVDMRFRENVLSFVDEVNKIVEVIEAEDPYIKEVFGVSGVGEGLVFYPGSAWTGYCKRDDFSDFAFKVKGEKHAVNKAGKPARVHSTIPKGAYEFADQHVTEARLEQGLQEVGVDISKTGQFIGWVCRDVAVESAQEIEESGFNWKKDLAGVVANRAREFYIKKCEEI